MRQRHMGTGYCRAQRVVSVPRLHKPRLEAPLSCPGCSLRFVPPGSLLPPPGPRPARGGLPHRPGHAVRPACRLASDRAVTIYSSDESGTIIRSWSTTGPLIHTIGLLLEAPSPPRVLLAHTHRPLTSVLKGSGCMEHLFAAAEKRGVSARELYARREGVAFVSLIEMTRGESMEGDMPGPGSQDEEESGS